MRMVFLATMASGQYRVSLPIESVDLMLLLLVLRCILSSGDNTIVQSHHRARHHPHRILTPRPIHHPSTEDLLPVLTDPGLPAPHLLGTLHLHQAALPTRPSDVADPQTSGPLSAVTEAHPTKNHSTIRAKTHLRTFGTTRRPRR